MAFGSVFTRELLPLESPCVYKTSFIYVELTSFFTFEFCDLSLTSTNY